MGYGYPYAYGGYGHAYGGYGLTYGLPVAHTVVKAADAEEPAVAAVKTVAAPVAYASAAYPYGAYAPYAAYGAYAAPVATHTVAKRSADAAPEADADAYYYGAYGRGYGYGNRYGQCLLWWIWWTPCLWIWWTLRIRIRMGPLRSKRQTKGTILD